MEIWKVISICFLLVYGIRAKCKCNLKELLKEAHLLKNNLTTLEVEKRELPEVDEEANKDSDSSEEVAELNTTKGTNQATVGGGRASNVSLLTYENHFEQNETEFRTNSLKDVCPHYKEVPELFVHNLANIWQVAYYKPAKMNITCFRMYIERVSIENRKAYKDQYSDFNGTIDWRKCYLEIVKVVRADNTVDYKRKHFLQGDAVTDKAVLDNIILTERIENTTKTITLIEESPDQWMTYKNLLLMRDCELGTVVVYSKVPTHANLMDVEHGLRIFGDGDTSDKVSCAGAFDTSEYTTKTSDRLN